MDRLLRCLAIALVLVSLVSSTLLLALDAKTNDAASRWAALISALPLLAVGFSFVLVQLTIRPARIELLKNLLLAATFLLWGVVQLMTQSALSKTLGDVVIALYVVDLAWTIWGKINVAGKAVN